jgi:hypothetical protein
MKLVFRISGDGSEIELKYCASSKRSAKSSRKYFVHFNLVPLACDPWEGNEGSGIIRIRLLESEIQKTVCRPNCACVGKSKTNCLKYFIVSSIKLLFLGGFGGNVDVLHSGIQKVC